MIMANGYFNVFQNCSNVSAAIHNTIQDGRHFLCVLSVKIYSMLF